MLRALVADTETTGQDEDARICEVAWIEIDENLEILDRRHSLINPERPILASASGVHGITDEDVANAPTMERFMAQLNYFKPGDEVLLIAHNAGFDRRLLSPYMPIVDELCTLRLARRTWPDAENHKLATLMYLLKLERGTSHRADGDVNTCLDLLRRIVETTGKSLQELYDSSYDPIWVPIMPFGKHKGMKIEDVPASYVSWLLTKNNLDRDLRWTLEQVNAQRMEAIRAGRAP